MLKIHRWICGAALISALTGTLAAQQAPTGFQSVACVKVKRGQDANFTKLLNGDGTKLEQARVNSGAIAGWLVLRTEIPAGRDATCDYVFLTFYHGLPTPMSNNGLAAALKTAGLTTTPQEFLEERDATGYLVNDSIIRTVTLVGNSKEGDYVVVNSMSAPDRGAAIAYENRMWKPLAESMVKSGAEDAWVMNVQVFPNGTKDKYLLSTADVFPSRNAWMQSRQQYGEHWKTVHPNTDIYAAIERFGALDPIQHTVLYKIVKKIVSK